MSAEAEAAPLATEVAPADPASNGTAEASAGANPDSTEPGQAEPGKTEVTEAGEDKPGQPSGKTMFVMNIPTNMMFTFEDELKEIFSKYGEIKIIKRAGIQVDGGASSDVTLSAYIHFTNAESAEKSLEERGRIVGGNPLEIFVLKTGPNTVVADILPVTMKVECIRNLLVACGPINEVVKIPGRRTAFIEFQDEEGAKKALSLNTKLMINNVKIIIEKRDGNSKPVVGQKSKPVVNKTEVRRPFKRPGVWTRGGYSAPSPVQPPQQQPYLGGGVGGRGGGYRGGRGGARGVARGGYRGGGGGYAGGYWGNDFNSNDQSVNKRRKPNDWIRQY